MKIMINCVDKNKNSSSFIAQTQTSTKIDRSSFFMNVEDIFLIDTY